MTLRFTEPYESTEVLQALLGDTYRVRASDGGVTCITRSPDRGPWIVPLEGGLVIKDLMVPGNQDPERRMRARREWDIARWSARPDFDGFAVAALPATFPADRGRIGIVSPQGLLPDFACLHEGLYPHYRNDLIVNSVHGRAEGILQLLYDVASDACAYARQAAVDDMEFAHRDIKRANIVLTPNRPVDAFTQPDPNVFHAARLIDWGCATTLVVDDLTQDVDEPRGLPLGTPQTLPPEVGFDTASLARRQAISAEDVAAAKRTAVRTADQTHKGDVWALGTVAIELWAAPVIPIETEPANPHAKVDGRSLLRGQGSRNAWARHAKTFAGNFRDNEVRDLLTEDIDLVLPGEHRRLTQNMPRQLRAVVSRCLHIDPALRPTMRELRDTLGWILDGDRSLPLDTVRGDATSRRLTEPGPDGTPHLPYSPAQPLANVRRHDPERDVDRLTFDQYRGRYDVEKTVVDACYVTDGLYRTARQRTDVEALLWAVKATVDRSTLARISTTPAGLAVRTLQGATA
jgi:serine/threonine protein kinase